MYNRACKHRAQSTEHRKQKAREHLEHRAQKHRAKGGLSTEHRAQSTEQCHTEHRAQMTWSQIKHHIKISIKTVSIKHETRGGTSLIA
jgi:hypothetical protein